MVTMSSSAMHNQQQYCFAGRAGLLYSTQRRRKRGNSNGLQEASFKAAVVLVFGFTCFVVLILTFDGRLSIGTGRAVTDGDAPPDPLKVHANRHLITEMSDESSQVEMQVEQSMKQPVMCSSEMDLYCPPDMKCCPKYMRNGDGRALKLPSFMKHAGAKQDSEQLTIVGYTCLASSKGKYPIGECCAGTIDDVTSMGTGCSIGYTCAPAAEASAPNEVGSTGNEDNNPTDDEEDGLANVPHCQKDPTANPVDLEGKPIKFEYERMPRYHTCDAMTFVDVSQPLGLLIPKRTSEYGRKQYEQNKEGMKLDGKLDEEYLGQLAYFTNRGPINLSETGTATDESIKTAIITIHGSSRVSTNYLCYMTRAVKDYVTTSIRGKPVHGTDVEVLSPIRRRQQQQTEGSIAEEEYIVIAPWFLAPQDGEPTSKISLPFLMWDDEKPIAHTFRYGAESLEVDGSTVSSYAAMDVLLETLCSRERFPNLERIVVAGHSAGGQFVHRWSLSSSSWCFDNGVHPKVKLVAANPRSYAYLDGRRYFPTDMDPLSKDISDNPQFVVDDNKVLELRETIAQERDACTEYNSYEWGLEDNPNLPAPYIMSNIGLLENKNDLNVFCRYASRDVVYLSGLRDVEKLGNQICHEDGYQGPTRRQRSERFFSSLQVIGQEENFCRRDGEPQMELGQIHERVGVKNVGHDHSLIYVAEEGQRVLFE